MSATPPVFLKFPEVVKRHEGRWSEWTLYEWTRHGRIPHRKLPGRRHLIFPITELVAFENGCELETVKLADGGRICRPAGDL